MIPVGSRLGSQRLFDTAAGDRPRVKPDTAKVSTKPAVAAVGNHTVKARGRLTEVSSTVLELAGISAIAGGCWLVAPFLGLIVLGLCMVLLGIAMGWP